MLKMRLLKHAIGPCLLFAAFNQSSATTVATVGDSFADAIYLGMKARPDLLKKHGVSLVRWSRPKVGLARPDYFDYANWLEETADLGVVDLCVIQIGSNDMQGILVSAGHWLTFGTEQWKSVYSSRVLGLFGILRKGRCKQLVWILQPGFEKRDFMARNHTLINQLQSDVLKTAGAPVFDVITTEDAYGSDDTHFNRIFTLKMGQAVFQLTDVSRNLLRMRCLSCHDNVAANRIVQARDIFPLQTFQGRFENLAEDSSRQKRVRP
jgi:hypothetical protein